MNYGLLAPDEREQLSGTALTSGLLSALAGAAGSSGRPWGQVIANSLAGGLQGYQGTFDNALQSKLMQQKMLQQDQEFGLRNQELKMRMAEAQRQQEQQAQQQAMLPKLAEQFKVQPELLQMYPDVAKDLIKRQLIPQTAEVGSVPPDKFTPESLAKFRQSNNYADLVPLEKQTSGTALSKLMTEMNSLPEGDPRRQMYADAIKKETQFAPAAQQTTIVGGAQILPEKFSDKLNAMAAENLMGQYGEAKNAATAVSAVKDAVTLLDQGMFTGRLGPWQESVAGWYQAATGNQLPKLDATQQFKTVIGDIVLPALSNLKGASSDRDFIKIEEYSRGEATMTESALRGHLKRLYNKYGNQIKSFNSSYEEYEKTGSPKLPGLNRLSEPTGNIKPVTSSKPPMRGQVVDGWKYMGGDPADRNNWRKQ